MLTAPLKRSQARERTSHRTAADITHTVDIEGTDDANAFWLSASWRF